MQQLEQLVQQPTQENIKRAYKRYIRNITVASILVGVTGVCGSVLGAKYYGQKYAAGYLALRHTVGEQERLHLDTLSRLVSILDYVSANQNSERYVHVDAIKKDIAQTQSDLDTLRQRDEYHEYKSKSDRVLAMLVLGMIGSSLSLVASILGGNMARQYFRDKRKQRLKQVS